MQIDLSAEGDRETIASFENLQKSGVLPPAADSPDGHRLLAALERERARSAGRDPNRVVKVQMERGSSSRLHNETAAAAVAAGSRAWVPADNLARLVEETVTGGRTLMGGARVDHDPRAAGGLAGSYDSYDHRNPNAHFDREAAMQVLNDRAARAETTAKASLASELFKMREAAATDPSYRQAVEFAERKAREKGHRKHLIRDYNKKLGKLQRQRLKSQTLSKSSAPMFKQTWDGRSVDDIRRSWGDS